MLRGSGQEWLEAGEQGRQRLGSPRSPQLLREFGDLVGLQRPVYGWNHGALRLGLDAQC